MHWMHQGPKHLGAQTRATGTRTPNPEVEESTRSMRPKKTLKQACFQGYPESAVYVQIPVGSRNSASRNAYHTSLRPSSLFEPRHPSLNVLRQMEWSEAFALNKCNVVVSQFHTRFHTSFIPVSYFSFCSVRTSWLLNVTLIMLTRGGSAPGAAFNKCNDVVSWFHIRFHSGFI